MYLSPDNTLGGCGLSFTTCTETSGCAIFASAVVLPGWGGLLEEARGELLWRAAVALVMALALVYLAIGFNVLINKYDEGLALYGAVRVLRGEIPYRDFWTCYSPGYFYLLAGVFRVFGEEAIVPRYLGVLTIWLISVVSYFTMRKFASRGVALLIWAALVARIGARQITPLAIFPAVLFSLLSCLCVLQWMSVSDSGENAAGDNGSDTDSDAKSGAPASGGPDARWLVAAGLMAGVTALLRYDFGIYTAVAGMVAVAGYTYMRRQSPARPLSPARALLPYAAGLASLTLPVIIYFLTVTPLADLVYDFVVFPFSVYPRFRSLPFPSLIPNPLLAITNSPLSYASLFAERVRITVGPIVLVAAFGWLAIGSVRRLIDWREKTTWAMVLILLLDFGFFVYGRVRAHLLLAAIPALILLAMLLSYGQRRQGGNDSARWPSLVLWALALLVVLSLIVSGVTAKVAFVRNVYQSPSLVAFNIQRLNGIYTTERQLSAYRPLIRYVQANVPEGKRIFSGNVEHDRVFVNNVMIYFATGRGAGTRYHELHPGVATTAPVQREIVADLVRHDVRILILNMRKATVWEPNESGVSSGVTILDDFIRQRFEPVKSFGPYTVWRRK